MLQTAIPGTEVTERAPSGNPKSGRIFWWERRNCGMPDQPGAGRASRIDVPSARI